MLRIAIHFGLHIIAPFFIAYFFFNKNWKLAYILMLLTMLIDLDHLLATPIFDPNRCSINFHPLHTYWALAVYIGLLFFKRTRIIGIGLVLHIITDALDCLWL
ncbi:MAG: hypothetical protein HQ471_10640 [Flavobacteriales bacterium]|nr:hypothetical protein [Flavobacteriales bacterium]